MASTDLGIFHFSRLPHAPSTLCAERSAGACSRLSAIQLIGRPRTPRTDTILSIVSIDRCDMHDSDTFDWMAADDSSCNHPVNCHTGSLVCQLCKDYLLNLVIAKIYLDWYVSGPRVWNPPLSNHVIEMLRGPILEVLYLVRSSWEIGPVFPLAL